MKEKVMIVTVNCKRCGVKMAKVKRSQEDEALRPFPFDTICGYCITLEEAKKAYPSVYKKKSR